MESWQHTIKLRVILQSNTVEMELSKDSSAADDAVSGFSDEASTHSDTLPP